MCRKGLLSGGSFHTYGEKNTSGKYCVRACVQAREGRKSRRQPFSVKKKKKKDLREEAEKKRTSVSRSVCKCR